MKHTKFTVYYLHRNGQIKSTNKTYGTLLTKLVNENQNNGMNTCSQFIFLQFKKKVGTNHTPFQLVYELHSLLPTKYLLPSKSKQIHDPRLVEILISQLSKVEKLQEI